MVEYRVQVFEDKTAWCNLQGTWHREDGPALEYKNGTKIWVKNGQFHREDGPAKEFAEGTKAWFIEGIRHRLDGPAIEYSDGRQEWYIEGKKYTELQFNAYIQKLNRPCVGKKVIVDGIEYELK